MHCRTAVYVLKQRCLLHIRDVEPAPGVRDVEGVSGPQEYISPLQLCNTTWITARSYKSITYEKAGARQNAEKGCPVWSDLDV